MSGLRVAARVRLFKFANCIYMSVLVMLIMSDVNVGKVCIRKWEAGS